MEVLMETKTSFKPRPRYVADVIYFPNNSEANVIENADDPTVAPWNHSPKGSEEENVGYEKNTS